MPGKRSELEGFRLRFRASLLRLHTHLQAAKVEQVESEKEFEAETALGLLHGSTDLLLSFGGSREAVIDMKWAGTSKYRKVLEQGSHLQLAVYAFLQERASKRWPAVGYYILREGDLLTPAGNLFPDARPVSQEEGVAADRPFIAALAISKARGGLPAPGFFDCARRLGRFAGDSDGQDERTFHAAELTAVFARWGGSRDN